MSDEDREEMEQGVVDASFAEVQEDLHKLFERVVEHAQCVMPLAWFARPDAGYTEGRDDPNSKFVVAIWELVVHEVVTEMVGGKHDGEEVCEGFLLELGPLLAEMEPPEGHSQVYVTMATMSHSEPDSIGIHGKLDGKEWVITILCHPPRHEKPSFCSDEQGHMWEKEPTEEEDDD